MNNIPSQLNKILIRLQSVSSYLSTERFVSKSSAVFRSWNTRRPGPATAVTLAGHRPLLLTTTVQPSTYSPGVLVERFLASIQSAAARLYQKVQECNVMARGMSSTVRPSVPCLQTALLLQSAATGREHIICGESPRQGILLHGKHV